MICAPAGSKTATWHGVLYGAATRILWLTSEDVLVSILILDSGVLLFRENPSVARTRLT